MSTKLKAIIIDMDGVISDTQKVHAKVESDILGKFGVHIEPDEITRRYAGMKAKNFFHDLLKDQPMPYDVDQLMVEKWKMMAELGDGIIDGIDGSVELIQNLYDMGYKMAVASASDQLYVQKIIKSLNLEKYFEYLISGDMVKHGKPDPEIFLLAASKLGIEPESCLVIEDGVSGMVGAKAGNMKCIGLVPSKDREYPTENLVLSLREVTEEYLENL